MAGNGINELIEGLLLITNGHSTEKPLENWQPFNLYCKRLLSILDRIHPELTEEQFSALATVLTRVCERKQPTILGVLDYYGGKNAPELLVQRAACEKCEAVQKILRDSADSIVSRRKIRQEHLNELPNTKDFKPLRIINGVVSTFPGVVSTPPNARLVPAR